MNDTIPMAHSCAPCTVSDACADALRALAEASGREPASAGLIARLNPRYSRSETLHALKHLHELGLVAERRHVLSPVLTAYTLSPAGRAWVRHHG